MNTKPHPFSLPFSHKEQVAKDTFAFYFDRVKRTFGHLEDWDFYPGQYIQMMLPNENSDNRGTMRYFTISSSPLDKKYLRVLTKVIQSTFKMTLAALKPGQVVSFFGPNGDFYLREKKSEHVLLAGGIGMTPFISMLEYATVKNLKNQITLFVAFSTPDEMIFFNQLIKISDEHENINVIYTITKPSTVWTGETGRISSELIKKNIIDVIKPLYYITGPPLMVEATVKMVQEIGISEDQIFQEHFSGY